MPYHVFGVSMGAAALTSSCRRSPITRSASGISASFSSTARSPSAPSRSAFSSWARSRIAARSSAVNPFDALFPDVRVSAIPNLLPVLQQPEHIAIRVADGGDQAAAADVAHGILDRCAGGRHLGELRLDVRDVPVRDRRGDPL